MTDKSKDGEQDYYRDSRSVLAHLARYINEHYGEPCRDTNADCVYCQMWGLYGAFKRLVDVPDAADDAIRAKANAAILKPGKA